MDETPRFLATPTSIRIAAALMLALLVLASPFALIAASFSVMAFDAGVSSEATAFVLTVWGSVLLLFVAGILAVIALIRPRRGLIYTILLLSAPCLLAAAWLVIVIQA